MGILTRNGSKVLLVKDFGHEKSLMLKSKAKFCKMATL